MAFLALLLSVFVFSTAAQTGAVGTNGSKPKDDWFRCTKDIHCTKAKDKCGRYKAISASFAVPYARYVEQQAKTVDCSAHPDPSDPNALKRRQEELRMQEKLKPYCLSNVCALH